MCMQGSTPERQQGTRQESVQEKLRLLASSYAKIVSREYARKCYEFKRESEFDDALLQM